MTTPADSDDRQRALLANMRQELLAPANALVGYSEIVRDEAVRGEMSSILPDVERILDAGRDLFEHVDLLLDRDHAQSLRDGTDSKLVQRALRHDLRTPINIIKGYGEMILEELDDLGAGALETDLTNLVNEADVLLSQLDQIIDFSRTLQDAKSEATVDLAAPATAQSDDAAVETGYILVVDDNQSNRDLLSRRLSREGHKVATAPDGPSALAMVNTDDFDVILLDVMMPGMDGFTVCRTLKSNDETRLIPVLIMTALDAIEDRIQGIEAGADDFLIKPVNNKELLARIGTVLKLKRLMDEKLGELRNTRDQFAKLYTVYQVTKVHKERMEAELSIGRDIQMSMIPLSFPDIPEFGIHAMLEPAREVGGDFYDLFFIDDDHFCFCVGDVVGKGVPAALFMAVTKTVIKSRARSDSNPASILTHVNDELSRDNPNSMFATVMVAVLDIRTGRLRYCNAGHNPPLIRRHDDSVVCLDSQHQLPVGAMGGVTYEELDQQLSPGEHILLYSDGVTEAMDTAEQLFGEDRLMNLFGEGQTISAQAVTERVLAAVHTFAGEAEQSDDITVLDLQFHGRSLAASADHRITIRNRAEDMARVAEFTNLFCNEHAIDDGIRRRAQIVLDDLIANVITHGYPEGGSHDIDIALGASAGRLTVMVIDDGRPFDPFDPTVAPDESKAASGASRSTGIDLIRGLAQESGYECSDGRNIVTVTFASQPSSNEE